MKRFLACVLTIAICLAAGRMPAESPSPSTPAAIAYEDFLIVPLRVHVLASKELEEINCQLTDDDLARIIGKVNGVWSSAGIHFVLAPIEHETASQQEKFKERAAEQPSRLDTYLVLRPKATRKFDGMHVYYVHQLPVNGVFLGGDVAFVQDAAALHEVPGGIDEPIPRVTSHELGHALSLAHRQDKTNLMASGTTGTSLNEAEIKAARESAAKRLGKTVAAIREKAEQAEHDGRRAEARELWGWLAEIPGDEASEAKKRHDALDPEKGPDAP